MHEIAPLHLAEVGHDQVRVVGGDTGPSADREKLCCFWLTFGCSGAAMGSPWVAGTCDCPLDPYKVRLDQSSVVDRDTEPSVPHTSHMFNG